MEVLEDWEEIGFVGIFCLVLSFILYFYSFYFLIYILILYECKVKIFFLIILNWNS